MKPMKNRFHLAFLFAVLTTGCAAPYNKNFPLIEKRMALSKVTELLGKPVSAQSGPGDSKILFYRLASSPLDTDGSDTREYWVQMQDGVVIGYGERTDAATFMRQAMQFESAWNASRSINDTNKTLSNSLKGPIQVVPSLTTCPQMGTTTRCQIN
jgi:hypothetical protein